MAHPECDRKSIVYACLSKPRVEWVGEDSELDMCANRMYCEMYVLATAVCGWAAHGFREGSAREYCLLPLASQVHHDVLSTFSLPSMSCAAERFIAVNVQRSNIGFDCAEG